MASQQVHFIHHLATAKVDLSLDQNPKEVAIIPKDSEVTYLSVEVIEPANAAAKLDIGYGGNQENLANDIDITTAGVKTANIALTPKKNEIITASIASGKPTQGVYKVRVGYFVASQRPYEI